MHKNLIALSAAIALLLSACASAPPAPRKSDGGKIALQVSVDGGWDQVDEGNSNQVSQRRQLVGYMEKTTVDQLNAAGYEAALLDEKQEPAQGSRLLKLRILNYNPGSAAARFIVGFGAGAATLDIGATYRDGSKTLLTTEKSVASGRDWRKIVRKINIQIMQEMAARGEG